jgi:hypothetical protein
MKNPSKIATIGMMTPTAIFVPSCNPAGLVRYGFEEGVEINASISGKSPLRHITMIPVAVTFLADFLDPIAYLCSGLIVVKVPSCMIVFGGDVVAE